MQNSITLVMNEESEQKKLLKYYSAYRVDNADQFVRYLFKLPNCRITVYNSGKVLFQGKEAVQESSKWQSHTSALSEQHKIASESLHNYCGCDETGVGDYFAPLVACCAYVNDSILEQIASLNIKDSKQLNDEYILQIAPELQKIVPHAIVTLSNNQYNQFIDNQLNAHAIKVFVHQRAITKLFELAHLDSNTPIVMDAFTTKSNYSKHVKRLQLQNTILPTIFAQKAENKFPGVAIASIIGRSYFLSLMSKQNKQYGTTFPLGAGKQVDDFGKKLFKRIGETEFKTLVKWHFANTKRIIE